MRVLTPTVPGAYRIMHCSGGATQTSMAAVGGTQVCVQSQTWNTAQGPVTVAVMPAARGALTTDIAGQLGIQNAAATSVGGNSVIQGVTGTGQQALAMAGKHGVWYVVICQQVAGQALSLVNGVAGGLI